MSHPTRLTGTRLVHRRFNRIVGFWLGGFLLEVVGCLVGSCLPHHHRLVVTIGIHWWGFYLGCFGASLGALVGMWAEGSSAPPSPRQDSGDPEGTGSVVGPVSTAVAEGVCARGDKFHLGARAAAPHPGCHDGHRAPLFRRAANQQSVPEGGLPSGWKAAPAESR
jgi:hypothetical protein